MKTTNYCTMFRNNLVIEVYDLNTSNADLLLSTASSKPVHHWTFSFAENHFSQCRQFWADCENTQVPMWPKIDMFHFLSTSGIKFNNRINIGEKPKKFQTTFKFILQHIYCMLDTWVMLFSTPVAVLGTNKFQKSYRFINLITVSGCDCILCIVNMAVKIIVDKHTINNRIILFVLSREIKINSFPELRQIKKIKFLFLKGTKISPDKAMSTNSALNPLAPPWAPSQAISSSNPLLLCASSRIGFPQSSVALATTRLEVTNARSSTQDVAVSPIENPPQSSTALATVRLNGLDFRSDTTASAHHSSTISDELRRCSVALATSTSAVIISLSSSDAYSMEADDVCEAGLLTPLTRKSLRWRKLGIFPRAAAAAAFRSEGRIEQQSSDTAEDLENQNCKLQDRPSLLLQAQNQTLTVSASFSSELPAITDVKNGQV